MKRTSAEISGMFSEISRRYDFANRILSLGLDRSWRAKLIKHASPKQNDRVLDLCTGTADLICDFSDHQKNLVLVGLDLSRGMLEVGQQKIQHKSVSNQALLIEGDVLKLPFREREFDILSISFGLRNLTDRVAGFREMYRVLNSGGRILVLEFSLPTFALWRGTYKFYLRYLLPTLGGLLTGSRSAYQYLHDTICEFPSPVEIQKMMRDSGFLEVQAQLLIGGVAVLYSGSKS